MPEVIILRSVEATERKQSAGNGGFRKFVDQIFLTKTSVEKYLGKERKIYTAFMEKEYDRVD